MNAHRVEVLDRADDHDVVGAIADDLQLELVPAPDRLLDEHLADRGSPRGRARPWPQELFGCVQTNPPPCPPSVNAGRMTAGVGKPVELAELDVTTREIRNAEPAALDRLLEEQP